MSITAQSIIKRAAEALQDLSATRWKTDELVRYLNDGQREIVIERPDATRVYATATLAAGARQEIPANIWRLIEVERNSTGTKSAIRRVARDMLDAQNASWYSMTPVDKIAHFTYDEREPATFYVYPPAIEGTQVEIVCSATPTEVAEPAANTTFTAVTGNIGVGDVYANALLNYILFRSYAKDAEYGGNAALSAAHKGLFDAALGKELKGTVTFAPKAQ